MTLSHPDPGFVSLNPIRPDPQILAVPQSYYLPLFPSGLTPILARPRVSVLSNAVLVARHIRHALLPIRWRC